MKEMFLGGEMGIIRNRNMKTKTLDSVEAHFAPLFSKLAKYKKNPTPKLAKEIKQLFAESGRYVEKLKKKCESHYRWN